MENSKEQKNKKNHFKKYNEKSKINKIKNHKQT